MDEQRITADGRILERMPDGSVVEVGRAGGFQGAIPIGPRDTSKAQSQAMEVERLRLARQAAANASAANDRAAAAAARADIEFWATHNPDGTPKKVRSFKPLPDSAAKRYEDAINAFADLDRAIGTFEDQFAGNTVTGGLENTIQKRIDSFGTPGQAQWWSDIQTTDNALRNALFGASLTAGESKAWDQTTVNPSMDPLQVEENLRRRRDLAKGALSRRTNFLKANGYDPDAVSALAGEYGEELSAPPVKPTDREEAAGRDKQPPTVGAQIVSPTGPQGFDPSRVYNQDSAPRLKPASGALLGPEQRQEYDYDIAAQVSALIRSGASDEAIDGYVRQRGYPGYDGASLNAVRQYLQTPAGRSYQGNLVNPPVKAVDQSALERFSQGAPGAALIGATNMGSFGGVQALAPEQYALANEAHPGFTMGGEVGGAIAGTQGLGLIGRQVTKALAPKLLGGGTMAQFGRNLAADAAYGAAYGGVTEGDPLSGAIYAAGGSALGQGVGGLAGKALRGATPTYPAQTLIDRGVEGMTVGQKLGGAFKSIEERFAGMPIVGDRIGARNLEAFDSFNRAALNEAGAPVGATVTDTGERGLQQLLGDPAVPGNNGAIGQAYDQAVQGVNVPLDPQFLADVQAARAAGQSLPPDLATRFNTAMQNRIDPITGQMTGGQYQQAMRGLKGYKAEATKPGFEGDYRDALSGVQNALKEQMKRGGGPQVVEGLGKADQAYRLAKTIQAAQSAAKGGSSTGELRVFSPSQLLNASEKAAAKYPGPRPFAELADAGQKALPAKIPDSGTAGRLAQIALTGTAVGGAGGGLTGGYEGAATGGGAGAITPLAILSLLALGASKKGQKGFDKLLFERSGPLGKQAAKLGRGLSKGQKFGLFGAPTIPFLLEAQQ